MSCKDNREEEINIMGSEKDRRLEVDHWRTPRGQIRRLMKSFGDPFLCWRTQMTTPIPGPKAQEIREDSFA